MSIKIVCGRCEVKHILHVVATITGELNASNGRTEEVLGNTGNRNNLIIESVSH